MKTMKRQYHPLVVYGFYAGLLPDDQLKNIPNSTLSYWRSFDDKAFFGYEWVSGYIETDFQTKDVARRKVGMTVIRFVGRMYKCYDRKNDKPLPFNTHNLNLQKGDILYLFTDGYADQFGGPKGKKFKYKQMQELLLANAAKSMDGQKRYLKAPWIAGKAIWNRWTIY